MKVGATRMEIQVGDLRTPGRGQTSNFDDAMHAARLRYDRYPLTRYSSASRTYEVSPSPFPMLINFWDDKAEIADVRESMIEKAAKAWKELIGATKLSASGARLVATASPFSSMPSGPSQGEQGDDRIAREIAPENVCDPPPVRLFPEPVDWPDVSAQPTSDDLAGAK
jgi:hypothetical protein